MESIEIAPFRDLCTDCGVSRTAQPKRCATACQFIQPNYPKFETLAHGRERATEHSDEVFFGPYLEMFRARLKAPLKGAQWTGIITRLCEVLLEQGVVEAVITMSSDPDDRVPEGEGGPPARDPQRGGGGHVPDRGSDAEANQWRGTSC